MKSFKTVLILSFSLFMFLFTNKAHSQEVLGGINFGYTKLTGYGTGCFHIDMFQRRWGNLGLGFNFDFKKIPEDIFEIVHFDLNYFVEIQEDIMFIPYIGIGGGASWEDMSDGQNNSGLNAGLSYGISGLYHTGNLFFKCSYGGISSLKETGIFSITAGFRIW